MVLRDIKIKPDRFDCFPMDELRLLGIPMPDDVLFQFLHEHGHRLHIIEQFGDVELHSIVWALESLSSAVLVESSVYQSFEKSRVNKTAERINLVNDHWGMTKESKAHWLSAKTWKRSPLAFRGFRAKSRLHWIEGHTRLGALKGLLAGGAVASKSLHQVWVGTIQ